MTVSSEVLQSHLGEWLDQVLATGEPLEIERNGKRLILSPEEPLPEKLRNLPKRDCIVGDPEDLVHMDWSTYWNHDLP